MEVLFDEVMLKAEDGSTSKVATLVQFAEPLQVPGAIRRDSAQFSDLRTRVHDGAGGVGGARHVDLEDVCARPAHARRALDYDRPLRPLRRRQRRLAHPGGDRGPHRLAARTEGAAPAALALSHLRLTTPLLPLQVDQALFVPATVMATLVFNMLTGILLWEDYPAPPLRKDYPLRGRGERENLEVIDRDAT